MTMHEPMSDRIGAHHRARKAILYVRQSSAHQVQHNGESRRLQYAMCGRLSGLGWSEVDVIDEEPVAGEIGPEAAPEPAREAA